jgi:hypothetical protein
MPSKNAGEMDDDKIESVESELDAFARRVESLTGKENVLRPWPTLRILGRKNKERLWQMYLAYFVNPSRPHGFGGNFLEELLDIMFEDDFHPIWDDIKVKTEASGDDSRPDLVVYQEDRWLLCIEIKVDAEYDADQLSRHSDADELKEVEVDKYDARYIYIDLGEPDGFADSNHPFRLVTWEEVINAIDNFVTPSKRNYPVSSLEQLKDFRSVIANKIDMNENNDTQKLKDAYVEHREAIEKANREGKDFVAQHLAQEWVSKISSGGEYEPSFWDDSWDTYYPNKDSPGYGQVCKQDWKQDNLDVHFEHKPNWKHFQEGRLSFTLENEKDGQNPLKKDIMECWDHYEKTIDERTSDDMNIDTNGKNRYLMKSEENAYSYTAGDPDSYFSALKQALEDNEEVIDIIDTIIKDLPVDDYEEVDL